jgi:hypothetical protein
MEDERFRTQTIKQTTYNPQQNLRICGKKSVPISKIRLIRGQFQNTDKRLQFFTTYNLQLQTHNLQLQPTTTLKKKLIKPIQPLTNLNFATRIN